jgi:hypothetical protein
MRPRPNCTARARLPGGVLAAVGIWLSVCATVLFAVELARADVELGHSGETGRHRLADIYDSPGAVCDIVLPGHDSLGETRLRVNPPVIFARDRTDETDEQPVGWQVAVSVLDERSGAWRVVRQSETARELATDDLASYFDGEGWLAQFPLSGATYSVAVTMLWYDPEDPAQVEGQAIHEIEYFNVILRHQGEVFHGRTGSVCRAPR